MLGGRCGPAEGERHATRSCRRPSRAIAPLSRARNIAWWDVNVDANDENERRRAETELAYSNLLADAELFGVDRERRARPARTAWPGGGSTCSTTSCSPTRSRPRSASASWSSRPRSGREFSRHRGVVRGEEVDDIAIKRILRESDDVDERREAWEASKTVGAAVADDVRELARLRNESARSLGYRDWFALSIAVSELDEGKLLDTLAACDRATAEPFARWKAALDERLAKRFGCAVGELRPWHYADPFFQDTPPDGGVDLDPLFRDRDIVELGKRTFDGIGIDVDDVLGRSDLFPRQGKCQHAFCIDIDRDGDIRVLMNATDNHDSRSRSCTSSGTPSTSSATRGSCRGSFGTRISSRPRPRRSSSARSPASRTGSWRCSASTAARPPRSTNGCAPPGRPSSSSSPAGCSS